MNEEIKLSVPEEILETDKPNVEVKTKDIDFTKMTFSKSAVDKIMDHFEFDSHMRMFESAISLLGVIAELRELKFDNFYAAQVKEDGKFGKIAQIDIGGTIDKIKSTPY